MWLPKPIYNLLPTIYIVIGVLIASGVVYIGLHRPSAIYYLLLAAFCVVAGIVVKWMRARPAKSDTSVESGVK